MLLLVEILWIDTFKIWFLYISFLLNINITKVTISCHLAVLQNYYNCLSDLTLQLPVTSSFSVTMLWKWPFLLKSVNSSRAKDCWLWLMLKSAFLSSSGFRRLLHREWVEVPGKLLHFFVGKQIIPEASLLICPDQRQGCFWSKGDWGGGQCCALCYT